MNYYDEIQQDIDSGLYSLEEILEMHPEVSAAELMDAYDLSALISNDWDEKFLEKHFVPDHLKPGKRVERVTAQKINQKNSQTNSDDKKTWEMGEIPKNIQPDVEEGPPGENNGRPGCFGVMAAVFGLIVLIIAIVALHSPSPKNYNKPSAGTSRESQRCGVEGCNNLHMTGTGYYYCYSHTCAASGCKDRVAKGSKYCSKHRLLNSNTSNYSNNSKPSNKDNTSTKTDPYNAKDYANEDDFWEDYYNDFIDFDEAEQYWDAHH